MINVKGIALFMTVAALFPTAYGSDPKYAIGPRVCEIVQTTTPGMCEVEPKKRMSECSRECLHAAGAFLVKAECKAIGSKNEKFCHCHTNCSVGSSYGDPHYKSFDGTRFDFHGVCKYLLAKTTGDRNNYPEISIFMRNIPWNKWDVSVPGTVYIDFPLFHLQVEISDHVTINNQTTVLPFQFTSQTGQRKYLIEIGSEILSERHPMIQAFTLRTNFGFNLIKEIAPALESRANGVYVYLAQHPIFIGHTKGLLGMLDFNTDNDFISNSGTKMNPRSSLSQYEYGESFCLDMSETTPQIVKMRNIYAHEYRMRVCREDSSKGLSMKRFCDDQIRNNKMFFNCIGPNLNESADACDTDTCYSKSALEEESAACTVIEAFARECNVPFQCD